MNKFKCIIVDDTQFSVYVAENHIKKLSYLDIAATFTRSLDALEFLEKNLIDIVFLEIHMPNLNAFQLINKLRERVGENTPAFVLISGDTEQALSGYQSGAIGYVVKPILFEQFKTTVDRIIEGWKRNSLSGKANYDNEYFFIESKGARVKMSYKGISYLECNGNYIKFVDDSNERFIYNRPMHYMESFLSGHGFIRVHKSFIVSLHHINEMRGNGIIVNVFGKEPKLIPIGTTYREEVQKRIKIF